MVLDRRIKFQLLLFTVISVVTIAVIALHYIDVPAMLFGAGRYAVTVELERAAGLYPSANVTYRGTQVGRVTAVEVTDTGVRAKLALNSDVTIPSPVRALVHSQSAVGEQYVELRPTNGAGRPLADGDVIPVGQTSVPPDIDALLDATDRGLAAIPGDDLRTAIDESYAAVGGLGSELSRMVNGSTRLAIDADQHLDAITGLIDQAKPVLDSQADSAADIRAWATHLDVITRQLETRDSAVAGLLHNGGPAADEGRKLLERLQPTLPLLLANLTSIADVAITYQPALEQLLVLFPQGVAVAQAPLIPNLNTKQDFKGFYLDFNTNLNLPPVCTTGYLPAQQQRSVNLEDYPDRPAGDLYCRVPQDSPFNVRGARNYPCLTVPGKRAPTAKMCESDEPYVPLNDGYNWKGDPNATTSGQDVPQRPPGTPPTGAPAAPTPIATAEYDPATGAYVGPDGRTYTQGELAHPAAPKSWKDLIIPPDGSAGG